MKFTQWVVEYAFNDFPDLWGPVIVNTITRRPLIVDTKHEAGIHVGILKKSFKAKDRTYRVRKVTFGEIDCE